MDKEEQKRERKRQYAKEYNKRNRERLREYQREYRRKKAGREGPVILKDGSVRKEHTFHPNEEERRKAILESRRRYWHRGKNEFNEKNKFEYKNRKLLMDAFRKGKVIVEIDTGEWKDAQGNTFEVRKLNEH